MMKFYFDGSSFTMHAFVDSIHTSHFLAYDLKMFFAEAVRAGMREPVIDGDA